MSFPSFQVFAQRDSDTGEPNIVLYRKDKDGNEFVANLQKIEWEKFDGCVEDRHKQEISDSDLKTTIIAFGQLLAGQEHGAAA